MATLGDDESMFKQEDPPLLVQLLLTLLTGKQILWRCGVGVWVCVRVVCMVRANWEWAQLLQWQDTVCMWGGGTLHAQRLGAWKAG